MPPSTCTPPSGLPEAAARVPQPLALHEAATTDPAIFVGNLQAQLQVLSARAAQGPDWRRQLAGLQYFQARLSGRVEHLEAADRNLALLRGPLAGDPAMHLLDARLHSAFHRFDRAAASLDAAERIGAPPALVRELRAQLRLVHGDVAAARDAAASLPAADFQALALRANLLLDEDRLAEAERLFDRAQHVYAGSSPYPLAWLHTQHGVGLLRYGHLERARDYFRAAHARLPQFTLATEHLAETEHLLGNHDAAATLYGEAIAASGDPEFHAALAEVERARGNSNAADRADGAADAGFRALLGRHPAAYWQHAAEFYSARGSHAFALELAHSNRALRGDVGSAILLAEVAFAAGERDVACGALHEAGASGLQPPELQALRVRGREACRD